MSLDQILADARTEAFALAQVAGYSAGRADASLIAQAATPATWALAEALVAQPLITGASAAAMVAAAGKHKTEPAPAHASGSTFHERLAAATPQVRTEMIADLVQKSRPAR